MNKINILTSIMFLLFAASVVHAQTGAVTVTIANINVENGGQVKIGIFELNGFPDVGQEVKGINLEANNTSLTHEFTDIQIGTYTISTFQDENVDGKLNKIFLEFPKNSMAFQTTNMTGLGLPTFRRFYLR